MRTKDFVGTQMLIGCAATLFITQGVALTQPSSLTYVNLAVALVLLCLALLCFASVRSTSLFKLMKTVTMLATIIFLSLLFYLILYPVIAQYRG